MHGQPVVLENPMNGRRGFALPSLFGGFGGFPDLGPFMPMGMDPAMGAIGAPVPAPVPPPAHPARRAFSAPSYAPPPVPYGGFGGFGYLYPDVGAQMSQAQNVGVTTGSPAPAQAPAQQGAQTPGVQYGRRMIDAPFR